MKQTNGEKRVIWLAKDKDGEVWAYRTAPRKGKARWQGGIPVGIIGDGDDYPELSWEDETAKRYTITEEEDEP